MISERLQVRVRLGAKRALRSAGQSTRADGAHRNPASPDLVRLRTEVSKTTMHHTGVHGCPQCEAAANWTSSPIRDRRPPPTPLPPNDPPRDPGGPRSSNSCTPANPWKNAGRDAKESHRGAPTGSPACRRPQLPLRNSLLSTLASIDTYCCLDRVQRLCVPPLSKRRSYSPSS